MRIRAVAVVNEKNTYCPPFGACRQVICEFGADAITALWESDALKHVTMTQLLLCLFQP